MLAGFCVVIFFVPEFFEIMPLSKVSALIVFVLTLDAFFIYKLINYAITFIANKIDDSISVESNIYKVG
jgi:hypothetical protein